MELGILRDSIAAKWGFPNDYILKKRIENSIFSARATIIQRRYDSTKVLPYSLLERGKCLDLVVVEEGECCSCCGIKSLRTEKEVPNPLIVKDNLYFQFVGKGTQSFTYVPFHQIDDIQHRKFTKNIIYYSYLKPYIYIINANSLKELDITYIPENLRDFLNFARCEDSECIKDGNIYIEDSLVEGIEGLLETRRPQIENNKDTEITLDD